MFEGSARITKQLGGRGLYAIVHVVYQDIVQERPTVGLDPPLQNDWPGADWVEAALTGAALGMEVASLPGRCVVTRIDGMVCDTNPITVAVAAMRAVWAATRFHPDKVTAACVEDCLRRWLQLPLAGLAAAVRGT